MVLTADAKFTGPLFDGSAGRAVDRFMEGAQQAVGRLLVDRVQQRLDRVLVNPSGNYRHLIQAEVLEDRTLVTDGGVVYGPWLEGTGSRNTATRFKGYAVFRRTRDEAAADVATAAEAELQTLVKELS